MLIKNYISIGNETKAKINKTPQATPCCAALPVSVRFTSKTALYIQNYDDQKNCQKFKVQTFKKIGTKVPSDQKLLLFCFHREKVSLKNYKNFGRCSPRLVCMNTSSFDHF